MYNMLKCEFFKLRKSKAFFAILLGLLIVGIITSPTDIVDSYINGLKDNYIIVFMVSIFAGIFIVNDFTNKTIKGSISCGTSRMIIFASKVIVFFFATVLFSIIYPLAAIIPNLFSNSPEIISLETIKTLFFLTIVCVLSNCAIASISILITFCFKDSGATIGVSIFAIFSLGNLAAVVLTTDATTGRSVFSTNVITENFVKVGIVAIAYIIIFLTIAYGIFRKAELK